MIVLGDGMANSPSTSWEARRRLNTPPTPTMDEMAQKSARSGLAHTVSEGMKPGQRRGEPVGTGI
ncbi:MAG: hypothetical protein V8Q27_05910 [Eubacteriales bacterium]